MRVTIVCPYDLAVPGGVQGQVTGLAQALTRTGASVHVLAPSGLGRAPANASYQFSSIGKSISVAANGSEAPVAPGPIAMARTVAGLRESEPEVVHVHEPLTPGSSLAALLAGRRPIVATFHRSGSDALYRLEGRVLRRLARRIDAPVAVSEEARTTAEQVLGTAVAGMPIIPNGVELLTGPTPGARVPSGNEFVVAFVGRHEERKGLAVLLEAFEALAALQPSATRRPRLRVVGDGPDSAALRLAYKSVPSIEWLGAVDDAARTEVLRSADVFVAPSVGGESFGVVLLDAMAAGAPVVASDLPGYKLAAGEAACYFQAGDATALTNVLDELSRDAARLAALGEAGGERVQLYSLDAIAARYLELYESLV